MGGQSNKKTNNVYEEDQVQHNDVLCASATALQTVISNKSLTYQIRYVRWRSYCCLSYKLLRAILLRKQIAFEAKSQNGYVMHVLRYTPLILDRRGVGRSPTKSCSQTTNNLTTMLKIVPVHHRISWSSAIICCCPKNGSFTSHAHQDMALD